MTRPSPDIPIAATLKHRPMITPIADTWLLWCNCGIEESHAEFDDAMMQRWRHLGVDLSTI